MAVVKWRFLPWAQRVKTEAIPAGSIFKWPAERGEKSGKFERSPVPLNNEVDGRCARWAAADT